MCLNPITKIINGEEIKLPCGKCEPCLHRRTQDWAIKLINEAKYHEKACFLTLTFNDRVIRDKYSRGTSLGAMPCFSFDLKSSKEYVTKFIKRLRSLKLYKNKRITYYLVGEYGEKTHRPHWHMILFGTDLTEYNDCVQMDLSKSGKPQYFSQKIWYTWALGRISIQKLNTNNIIYISQYANKKFNSWDERNLWRPIQTFSNRSKMSCKYIRKFPEKILDGFITDQDGHKFAIPKSYIKNLKEEDEGSKYHILYEKYEEKLEEYLATTSGSERYNNELTKSITRTSRHEKFNSNRDF